MKQMILKIDDDADFKTMPEELQAAISKTKIQWPQRQLIGTKNYYGKRLILILSSVGPDIIEVFFLKFNLNWSILAIEGEAINQEPILKFMEESIVTSEDGETYSEPVINITGKLQTFAGHSWRWK